MKRCCENINLHQPSTSERLCYGMGPGLMNQEQAPARPTWLPLLLFLLGSLLLWFTLKWLIQCGLGLPNILVKSFRR